MISDAHKITLHPTAMRLRLAIAVVDHDHVLVVRAHDRGTWRLPAMTWNPGTNPTRRVDLHRHRISSSHRPLTAHPGNRITHTHQHLSPT